jgi:hypothetical protein
MSQDVGERGGGGDDEVMVAAVTKAKQGRPSRCWRAPSGCGGMRRWSSDDSAGRRMGRIRL